MSYLRPLNVAISLAIGGYIFKSVTERSVKPVKAIPKINCPKIYVSADIPALHLPTTAGLNRHLHKSSKQIAKWWYRLMRINAEPASQNCGENRQLGTEADQVEAENDDGEDHDTDTDDEDADSSDQDEDENDEVDEPDEFDTDYYDNNLKRVPVLRFDQKNGDIPKEMPGAAYSLPHENVPTRKLIMYEDFVFFIDSRTKTPWWTVQRIERENLNDVEHRHCEMVKPECDLHPEFDFGNVENMGRIYVEMLRVPTTKVPCEEDDEDDDEEVKCTRCARKKFWPVFHKYIDFLLGIYEEVFVASGCLYLNGLYLDEFNQPRPTHYFKVICVKNFDGRTYRFECYKIKIEPECKTAPTPYLKSYLIPRKELETQIGFKIFDHVRNKRIKQHETHPGFDEFLKN
uniref:Uncharacterized protein n=1 Tax=Strigamia maritima TaxID=126957 RepID=T1IR68_STRMM